MEKLYLTFWIEKIYNRVKIRKMLSFHNFSEF